MRDRETDSWWSIMTSRAIGGEMDGATLKEIPSSEKTTWGKWRAEHPNSKVLAVTHVASNAYESYFSSDRVFRDLEVTDTRLAPRENIYAFEIDGKPVAAVHSKYEGGRLYPGDGGTQVLLFRTPGASLFESTRAYRVPDSVVRESDGDTGRLLAILERLEGSGDAAQAGVEPIGGIDTFWYNFVLQNPGARILE